MGVGDCWRGCVKRRAFMSCCRRRRILHEFEVDVKGLFLGVEVLFDVKKRVGGGLQLLSQTGFGPRFSRGTWEGSHFGEGTHSHLVEADYYYLPRPGLNLRNLSEIWRSLQDTL